ncbi:malate dehydrogenase [Methanomicrobiaceae archaeon CYW5]|uniref:malate dehydrogenase n=1 Tax=Methanovulcanius yangii TaxID=1789227 RepID=UPI0029CA5CB8|nr:malate dehydrogenase [Methanovulcanius yangii]MBT8508599.1 malate dehydrogenase [Methanovulcanius yangii]
MAKVTIIGASGHVGRYTALAVSYIPYVDEIVLYGREGSEEVLHGLACDLHDSFAARGTTLEVSFSTTPKDITGSDIVILTSGVPRRDGQDRMDLAHANARLVAQMAAMVGWYAPECLFLIVTNPVDVMTAVALKYSGMKPNQVFGLGTHLDSMRLKWNIAHFFGVHVSEVHTRIIGEHGDSMVPLWSATTIGGISIQNLPRFEHLPEERIMRNVKTAGTHIIRRIGATVYGPGDAISTIVRTVLGNENRILTVSAQISSEIEGVADVCIGVPAKLNRAGVFPVAITIDDKEVGEFTASADKIRGITKEVLDRLSEEGC